MALLGFAGSAGAQATDPDVAVVSPNVMLLVDTSGSMEMKSAVAAPPACVPDTPNTGSLSDQNEKSRWIDLMEVLTGTINHYSCFSESRSSPEFKTEFSVGPSALLPRDYNYQDFEYHRPMSSKCMPGAGDLPTTAPWDWPASPLSAIKYRPFAGTTVSTVTTCTPWSANEQSNDGLLDSFDGLLRFGLMTFDTEADAGTGVAGPNPTYGLIDGTPDYKNGLRGTWSYYLTAGTGCRQNSPISNGTECQSTYADGTVQSNQGGCCMGGPLNCQTLSPLEVGARNAAAPPWEGRMVAFGPSAEDGINRNAWIQDIIRATRPFGATPIAGMLNDARDFFWNDTTKDPLNKATGDDFGPSKDPQVINSCRQNYIVLLTDGEPNMDLRTPLQPGDPAPCEGVSSDKCPYDRAEDIVKDLANPVGGGHRPVRTFVVGFALDKVTVGGVPVDCKTLSPTDVNCANPTDPALRVCCTMNNIAFNGTPIGLQTSPDPNAIKYALFPQNAADLRTALSTVLSTAAGNPASRTYPVTVPAALGDLTPSGSGTKLVGYEFTSGLNPGDWKGILNRTRLACGTSQIAAPVGFSETDGDDFIANVNVAPEDRTMFTVGPPGSAVGWNPMYSVRPYFKLPPTLDDGVHFTSGVPSNFLAPADVKGELVPSTLGITPTTCTSLSAQSCMDRIVDYMVGLPSATPVSRCPRPDKCNVVGDIFHSVPQVRNGVPSEFLRDATYTEFARRLANDVKRDTVLYTSTNDGFFHGFYLTAGDKDATRLLDKKKRNELWAFVPPAVLPAFVTMYPTSVAATNPGATTHLNRVAALDGVPVIRDVGATQGGTNALDTTASTLLYPYQLERKKFPGTGESHTWRTVMAQAFGARMGGFFALDITTPNIVTADKFGTGPKFLWQLTTDDAGKQIFGKGSPTPLITTLFVDLSNLMVAGATETTREVPVAVLPGGTGSAPSATPCGAPGVPMAIDGSEPTSFRGGVRCYNSTVDSIAARSLTIVRLDTGQILRTFRPILPAGLSTPVTFDSKVLSLRDIPAPIVGQPAAYPSQTGQIADRIFVGDAEGRVWRVDVSKPKPEDWEMNVFFDAYWEGGAVTPQPVQTAPVLSVDEKGQITVAFSTGDQDNLTPDPTQTNYVVSVTETATTSATDRVFKSKLNWRHEFLKGEHALGPMTLFDRQLYYTTYVKDTSVASGTCDFGTSFLRGEHYVKPAGIITKDGGFIPPSSVFPQNLGNSVVAGAGLRQLPACTQPPVNGDSTDDFLGYGKTTTVSAVTPGSFELVVQKSGAKPTVTGSGPIATGVTPITAPRLPVRVDSWAPIIE